MSKPMPTYEILGNDVVLPNGALRHYQFPIAQVLERSVEQIYIRLDVSPTQICNENIYHLWLPGPTGWPIPPRPYGMPWCPYIGMQMRSNIAVCTGADGHVVELCGRKVLIDYPGVEGPPYIVDESTIILHSGVRLGFGNTIEQTLRFGETIIILTSQDEPQPQPRNVWAITRGGQLLWQVPTRPSLVPTDGYSRMFRADGFVHLQNQNGRILYIDPPSGKVIREEYQPY